MSSAPDLRHGDHQADLDALARLRIRTVLFGLTLHYGLDGHAGPLKDCRDPRCVSAREARTHLPDEWFE